MKIRTANDLPEHIRRMNSSQLNWNMPATASGHHKYMAKETWIDGIRFASKLESRCYEWLKLRQAAGEVLWFLRQVPFDLGGGVKHRVDFLAALSGGGVELIEAKGKDLSEGKSRRKIVEAKYGVKIQLWSGQ
jgi:hypothetical protein